MKEYKVLFIKVGMSPDKNVKKIENLLNEMGDQGWELISHHSLYWTFDREK